MANIDMSISKPPTGVLRLIALMPESENTDPECGSMSSFSALDKKDSHSAALLFLLLVFELTSRSTCFEYDGDDDVDVTCVAAAVVVVAVDLAN